MPVFAYRGLSAEGRAVAGVVDADSARTARGKLRASGIFPTEITEETAAASGSLREWLASFESAKMSSTELALFSRQLAALLSAGVQLVDALGILSEQAAKASVKKMLSQVRERVREVASLIFLEPLLGERAEALSHGQKQWLEIGMLLIQDPALLMLDEPVAGMSVSERRKTAELLRRVLRDRAVLVIEHDMGFVEDIAHRVTVLHQGRVLSEGSMQHVKSDPKVVEVYLGH